MDARQTTAMNIAVLVIDVQRGLCEGEGAAFDCNGTISRINGVTRKARAAGALAIFIQHESETGYLAYGSSAWQFAKGLEVKSTDARIRKTTPDAFLRTELEAILRNHGVQSVIVCGMHSEFCVDTTTRRALALGFPVVLVADGHTSSGNTAISAQQVIAHHNVTLTNISSFGPRAQAVAADNIKIAACGGVASR